MTKFLKNKKYIISDDNVYAETGGIPASSADKSPVTGKKKLIMTRYFNRLNPSEK